MTDARCPGCGVWPEMVRGAWWPHAPGAACRPAQVARAIESAVHAAMHGDGRVLCDLGTGTHAFQVGSRSCDCGLQELDGPNLEAAQEAAFQLDHAEEKGVVECGDGLHIFPNGGGRCKCGTDILGDPRKDTPSTPWYMER